MNQVNIQINGKDNLSPLINKLQGKIQQLNKQAGNIQVSGKSGGFGLGGGFLGSFAVYEGVGLIKEQTKAIIEQARTVEKIQRRFEQSAGGRYLGQEQMATAAKFAERYNLDLLTTLESYSKFSANAKGVGLTFQEQQKVFENMGLAISGLGLDAEQAKRVFYALGQILSKGKVKSEELAQQLGDVLPAAFVNGAKAMNMDMKTFIEGLRKGTIAGKEFVLAFSELYGKEYGGAALKQTDALEGKINQLANSFTKLRGAIWDTFGNETIKALDQFARFLDKVADKLDRKFGMTLGKKFQKSSFVTGFEASKDMEKIQGYLNKKDKKGLIKHVRDLTVQEEGALAAFGQKFTEVMFDEEHPEAFGSSGSAGTLQDLIGQDLAEKYNTTREQYMKMVQFPVLGNRRAEFPAGAEGDELFKEAQQKAKDDYFNALRAIQERLENEREGRGTDAENAKAIGADPDARARLLDKIKPELERLQKSQYRREKAGAALSTMSGGVDLGDITGDDTKLKTDYHTPRIININILTGEGASMVSGGINTDINPMGSFGATEFKNTIGDMIVSHFDEILQDGASSMLRVAKSSGLG